MQKYKKRKLKKLFDEVSKELLRQMDGMVNCKVNQLFLENEIENPNKKQEK